MFLPQHWWSPNLVKTVAATEENDSGFIGQGVKSKLEQHAFQSGLHCTTANRFSY